MQFIENKIKENLDLLKNLRNKSIYTLDNIDYIKSGYKKHQDIPLTGWKKFDINTCFEDIDEHYWFRIKIHTPNVRENEAVYFSLKTARENEWSATNPQGLVYIDGSMVQAVDTNHTTVLLEPNKEIELICYYYTGMVNAKSFFIPSILIRDRVIEKLYYDMVVPFESAKLLNNNEDRVNIIKHLEIALNMITFNEPYSDTFYAAVKSAAKYFEEEFYNKECGKSKISVSCIGHTHIDIAWRWTYEQTIEKAQRSFATVLNLMKQYPEYKFMSSQAILYEYVKDYAPELYEKIKQRVAEGRWEVDGAMWLECDCNLSSGESIVRQILHGKRFMKDEFGIESTVLWLPDTFGYSAAMPQILKKCGIKNFVTSKISWNDTNTIPHDTFLWQGIDGTQILTHFMTAQEYKSFDLNEKNRITTYVPEITPAYVLGAWARYQDKEYNDKTLLTFGYGDGGGGPTDEMLEYQRRLEKGIPGIPKTVISTAKEYLDTVEGNFNKNSRLLDRTPKWVGELYLEFHRGTYTSIGKNKKNNRKSEFAVGKTEFLSSVVKTMLKKRYPSEEINAIWKLILLNQFHDVLPGSSIEEVYQDSDCQYENLLSNCKKIISNNIFDIAGEINTDGGLLVINSTPMSGKSTVRYNDRTIEVSEVASYGWKVFNPDTLSECRVTVCDNTLENDYYRVVFNTDGSISSIFDKRFEREIVKEDEKFNQIKIFEDYPRFYDNWEINEYYKSKSWEFGTVESIMPVFDGSRVGMRIERNYLESSLVQIVWLYSMLERIDFETNIEWHGHHQIIKAFFPINVLASKATYEIQFGNVERNTHQNTSWDQAKFEVCANKWADISDGNYGVSLMNDSKYGYSCDGSVLSLTFLKCGTFPNKNADQGEHSFTYSILPHTGDFRNSTVKEAYILNQPFDSCLVSKQTGTLPENFSFFACDKSNVVIETVKETEKKDGIILRMFDAHNVCTKAKVDFHFTVREAYICDMLENEVERLSLKDNAVELYIKNYEILTLKVIPF